MLIFNRRCRILISSVLCSFIVMLVLSSCKSIPKLPEVPKDYEQSKMATIKLITANGSGFEEQFGGRHFRMPWIIPYWPESGAVSFDQNYIVYVQEEWESSNGKFFSERFKFNDKAVFSIPAGEYNVCAYKMPDSVALIVKVCNNDKPFKFEAGAKYEMYLSYSELKQAYGRSTKYTWYLKVTDIKKVKDFNPTPLNF